MKQLTEQEHAALMRLRDAAREWKKAMPSTRWYEVHNSGTGRQADATIDLLREIEAYEAAVEGMVTT